MHVKMSSAKWRPSCPGLNVLKTFTNEVQGYSLAKGRHIYVCHVTHEWIWLPDYFLGKFSQYHVSLRCIYLPSVLGYWLAISADNIASQGQCGTEYANQYNTLLPYFFFFWRLNQKKMVADTAKLTDPRTFADKRWVGTVKLLCIIMFNISKIWPKSLLGPVKTQKFSLCLWWIWEHHVDLIMRFTANSRLAPSQCETSLQSNAISHWLGTNLESS